MIAVGSEETRRTGDYCAYSRNAGTGPFSIYRVEKIFEQLDINKETALIGHSCGAGFLIRWLSENNIAVGKLVLVALRIDRGHNEKETIGNFFDFSIDPLLSQRTEGVTIFVSNDDSEEVLKSVEILKYTLNHCVIKRFDGKGHFTEEDMCTIEFPELI